MKLINLTPHNVVIVDEQGNVILDIPPSGQVARVRVKQTPTGEVCGIPVVQTTFEGVENLPGPREGVIYVVSSMVAQVVSGRQDVVAPDTSPESVVRDEDGRIVGVKRFQRW